MIEVYLNFSGNGKEVVKYYSEVFESEEPYVMLAKDMPESEGDEMKLEPDFLIHANIKTYAGDIMVSDTFPNSDARPTEAVWISVSHDDKERLSKTFEKLARDGEVIMPIGETFFSQFYGQVKDKFGFFWMFMVNED